MRWLRPLATPFGLACLACLVLVGWALWSAGLLDGPAARQVRTTSVYAAPGIDLDQAAAEQVIGNRRLVVVLLEPGADLSTSCARVRRAAAGTMVVLLSPNEGGGYDRYGCSQLHDYEDPGGLGRAMVAETTISRGVNAFGDRPLAAVQTIVINYDMLVRAGTIPDDARTVSPSLPRYLVAAAAVLAVLVGSAVSYAGARRAGRLATRHLARRAAASDDRRELSAATAGLAQQIIDLDRRVPESAEQQYDAVVTGYVELLDEVAADPDEAELARLTRRVEALSARCRRLARASGAG